MKKDKYRNIRVVIRQKDGKHDYYLFENTKKEYQRAVDWFYNGEGGLMGTLEEIMQYASNYAVKLEKELAVSKTKK